MNLKSEGARVVLNMNTQDVIEIYYMNDTQVKIRFNFVSSGGTINANYHTYISGLA